ncbi:hypothetical protein AM500_14540 [Bacillus sp. FJAT-18017]|uniref:glycoside hydrolase family 15 protein n=1 Tax=Bacillus sp. FJAT-18017 TaxID=1705566 RepID=UPI0006AF313B|nr:glycoside hydrolase family 15 protein [Bacillus sp. FJAT-18017]ALC90866.1 hypothetical protein AM500_14540 [Bacillus sp. FJAT-18017]
MRKKPYLIDGLIGNSKMLASLTKDGQLQRLNWPRIDFPQHLNNFYTGIYGYNTEKPACFMHEDGWNYEQYYEGNTNILVTVGVNTTMEIEIKQIDFVVPGMDVLVRDYTIRSLSSSEKDLTFIVYSDFTIDDRERFNTVLYNKDEDCLVHYHRQYSFAVGSSLETTHYQCGQAFASAKENKLSGREVMNKTDGALSWSFGSVNPGEERRLTVFIAAGISKDESSEMLSTAKRLGSEELYRRTVLYWDEFLSQATPIDIKDEKINNIYIRSLLTFKLLNDEVRGNFIAGPEVDEDYDYSGGYAYCWGRDAAYIATAVDQAGYHQLVSKFYYSMIATQGKDGAWDQRHYIDGVLAPTWGLQIDETGSILWGMNEHYTLTGDDEFIQRVWPAVEKGANFLNTFIDSETNLPLPSMDLWEKRSGEHLYSAASVYGGLIGSAEIARKLGHTKLAIKWEKTARKIKKAILDHCWNEESGSFLRALKLAVDEGMYIEVNEAGKETMVETNTKGYKTYRIMKDPVVDISLLGLNVPFNMIDEQDERMIKTAETIERLLTSPKVGGIERFTGDIYIGGNPWIISTLWLALYYAKIGRFEKARGYLDWSVKHANHLGLLPEQIDKMTGDPAWVMPLTWSHAMYVLTVIALEKHGELNVT